MNPAREREAVLPAGWEIRPFSGAVICPRALPLANSHILSPLQPMSLHILEAPDLTGSLV